MQRVLLVEDEPEIRHAISRYLALNGLDVTECNGALHACQLLEAGGEPYEILITDFHMPDGTGDLVMRTAQNSSPGTQRVLMTGNLPGVPEDVLARADLVIEKPIVFSPLAAFLKSREQLQPLHASEDSSE